VPTPSEKPPEAEKKRPRRFPDLLPTEAQKKRTRRVRFSRDAILFFAGLAGVIHETLFAVTDRPDLLLLFAAMMGLPLYLRRNGL
jgi:hypothetical protein